MFNKKKNKDIESNSNEDMETNIDAEVKADDESKTDAETKSDDETKSDAETKSDDDAKSDDEAKTDTDADADDDIEDGDLDSKKKKKKTKKEKVVVDPAFDEEIPERKPKKSKNKKKATKKVEDINIVKELLNLIIFIGVVIIISFVIIQFVGSRARVDGASMNPTLSDGDSVWVDKLSYTFGDPERFDVVVFYYNENTTYVKRIIGLPGETVRIDQNGNIFINEQLLQEKYGNATIQITNIGRANQPIELGEDEYFVLGDNRNNSSDSRWADVGNVHRDEILGKVLLRIYPFSQIGIIK